MPNDERVISGYRQVLAAVLLIAAGPALAQGQSQQQVQQQPQQQVQQEQIVRDPQALALLQKTWSAMGGEAWNPALGVQLSGNAEVYGENRENATFLLSLTPSGGRAFSITDDSGNTTSSTLSAGTLTVSRPGKPSETLPLHATLNLPDYFPLGLASKVLNDPSYSIIDLGQATLGSQSYSKIEIKKVFLLSTDRRQILSRFTDRYLYVDPSTYFIRRIESKAYSVRNSRISKTSTVDFDSYGQIGSYIQPASITEALDGRSLLHLTVTSVNPAQ